MPLPFTFDLEEKIIKTLFSELVRKDDTVKANAFKSYPKDHDEVSVTRHYYTNTMFCKNLKNLSEFIFSLLNTNTDNSLSKFLVFRLEC